MGAAETPFRPHRSVIGTKRCPNPLHTYARASATDTDTDHEGR